FGRVFLDCYGHSNQRAQGQRLACEVTAYRQAYPTGRVCLVGHSSGAAVVLTAAEALPPGSVDRIVLLAPSVSCGYDLRPALCCAREGIDVFYSGRDSVSLLLGVLGSTDGCWLSVAGYAGFRPVLCGPEDEQLYQGLRQHRWSSGLSRTGHLGGHFGCNRGDFLRDQVAPLLLGDPCGCTAP